MSIASAWSWAMTQPDVVKAAMLTAVVGIAALLVNSLVTIIATAVNNAVTLRKMRTDLQHDREKTELQLRHDLEKTSQQLAHDRSQKDAERRLTLRRDIYLGLAEYMHDCIRAVVNWSELSIEPTEILKTWRKAAKFTGQLHFMARPALIATFVDFHRNVDAVVIEVRAGRDKLAFKQGRLRRLRNSIDEHRRRRDAAAEMLRSKALAVPLPEGEFERLQRIEAAEGEAADTLAETHDELLAELQHDSWKLYAHALSLQKQLYAKALPVIAAARAELGEDIDMAVYAEVLAKESSTDDGAMVRKLFGVD